jgi:hypothetical protein
MTPGTAVDPQRPDVLVFVDLDDSVFNSARKCQPGVALEPAALLKNGDVISFTSPRQRALLQWLHLGARVIPVTARSVEGFARVLVDFPGTAVVSFGGVILDAQRRPDPRWAQRMAVELAPARAPMEAACAAAQAWIAEHRLDAWAKVVVEGGHAQYLLAKHRGADAQALAELGARVLRPWAASQPGWRVFQNDNNLTLLPPGLDKAHAVAHLMAEVRAAQGRDIVTIGIGDSLSDAGFLALCDYAMAPQGTQLGRRFLEAMG